MRGLRRILPAGRTKRYAKMVELRINAGADGGRIGANGQIDQRVDGDMLHHAAQLRLARVAVLLDAEYVFNTTAPDRLKQWDGRCR